MIHFFLTFSDGAKFADIAKNLASGVGFGNSFTFWSATVFNLLKQSLFPSLWTPPLMPYSIFVFFKVFGVNDFAVIATSFFYFLLTLFFVFLLAKIIFKNNLVGILSTLVIGFNYDLINYAVSGASESPFVFEIVAALYFVSLKKKWALVVASLFLILMYFTRPQAFIYIAGIMLYLLLVNFKIQKAIICFVIILIFGLVIDKYVLGSLSGRFFLYSVTARGTNAATQILSGGSASDSLRGSAVVSGGLVVIIKKIFYNLYNFFKLLPQIMSPYLFGFFLIGLFIWGKDKVQNYFKIATLFMVIVTFLVTAASIPFFRYLHPMIPLIYIIAVASIVEILKSQIKNSRLLIISSCILVLIFGVGQTFGVIFLDSRFEANTHNVGKPPVYVVLSQILKANTNPNQVVITNLDTWGSWYGERKTIWFPLKPGQLIDSTIGKIPFDAIYLTSYLADDQNYYMGSDWREIFDNPADPKKWICDGCQEISKEYILKGIYTIQSADDYERQNATSILLVKK